MAGAGWIKLHRTMLENPRSRDAEWLAIWIHLLLHACHTATDSMFNGKRVTLQRGQLVASRIDIAEWTGVNESKVKRVLNQLKIDQQIDQQAGVKQSMFTVLNWDFYQKGDQQLGQLVTSTCPASDQQNAVSTNKARGFKSPRMQECKNKSTHASDATGFKREMPAAEPFDPAELIYSAYPRKKAKKPALKSIRNALKQHPFEFLLHRTKAYAAETAEWPSKERTFIPYPATWFIQERFLDSEDTGEATVRSEKDQLRRDLHEPWQRTAFPEKAARLAELDRLHPDF